MTRVDGRRRDELRPVKITRGFLSSAEGAVLIEMGKTRVICTATVEDRVPPFLKGTGQGWVTGEYGMLPRSTNSRTQREGRGKSPSGRTYEIQRLIGRSLRAVTDTQAFGERTITLDCDVIEADGGTRTASVTGAYVALHDAMSWLQKRGALVRWPLTSFLAAVSVGIVEGETLLDLAYTEDSTAAVDMNVVMTAEGEIVEVQGTAEEEPFKRDDLDKMITLGWTGVERLIAVQKKALGITG
jgi:ribonuclease PH